MVVKVCSTHLINLLDIFFNYPNASFWQLHSLSLNQKPEARIQNVVFRKPHWLMWNLLFNYSCDCGSCRCFSPDLYQVVEKQWRLKLAQGRWVARPVSVFPGFIFYLFRPRMSVGELHVTVLFELDSNNNNKNWTEYLTDPSGLRWINITPVSSTWIDTTTLYQLIQRYRANAQSLVNKL